MLNTKRRINIEADGENSKKALLSLEYNSDTCLNSCSNPNSLDNNYNMDHIKDMVDSIIADEFPEMKNNSLLHELVTNSIISNIGTVQSIKNVLLYSKEHSVKEINDVFFEDGDIYIKCSV